jgi:hypothetical protein
VLSDITLEMDGMPLSLEVIDSRFPTVDTMRAGESAIRINMAATFSDLGAGYHRLHDRNTHQSAIGAYLANALVNAAWDRARSPSTRMFRAEPGLYLDRRPAPVQTSRRR